MALLEENTAKAAEEAKRKKALEEAKKNGGAARRLEEAEAEPTAAAGQKDKVDEKKDNKEPEVVKEVVPEDRQCKSCYGYITPLKQQKEYGFCKLNSVFGQVNSTDPNCIYAEEVTDE